VVKPMKKYDRHICNAQTPGVTIEYSRDCFHEDFTWQLSIVKEATENDLNENHFIENIGDDVWSTVIEINNCPFCGAKLRKNILTEVEFVHYDSSGWSIECL